MFLGLFFMATVWLLCITAVTFLCKSVVFRLNNRTCHPKISNLYTTTGVDHTIPAGQISAKYMEKWKKVSFLNIILKLASIKIS